MYSCYLHNWVSQEMSCPSCSTVSSSSSILLNVINEGKTYYADNDTLAYIYKLEKQNEIMKKALEFYCDLQLDLNEYIDYVDCSPIARQALKEVEEMG